MCGAAFLASATGKPALLGGAVAGTIFDQINKNRPRRPMDERLPSGKGLY